MRCGGSCDCFPADEVPHVALALDESHAVEDGPLERQRLCPASTAGVRVPGGCLIEVGGTRLLLSCLDFCNLCVSKLPEWSGTLMRKQTSSVDSGQRASEETRRPLHTLSAVGHRFTLFVKLPDEDVVVTASTVGRGREKRGEVRTASIHLPCLAKPEAHTCWGCSLWLTPGGRSG